MRKAVTIFLLYFIFITSSLIANVEAQNITITFSDLNLVKGAKILVYSANGNLIKELNTTDTIELQANQSYIFVLKPSEQVWFSNPFQAIELLKASFPSMLSYALFFVVIISSAYIIKKVIVG